MHQSLIIIDPFLVNFQDHADKLEDSPASTLKSSSEENDAGNGLLTPMERELDCTENVSSAKKSGPSFLYFAFNCFIY